MDKIQKFKEEAIVVEVDIMQDFYPGNPKYIGREDDKKSNEHLVKYFKENNLEIPDLGGPFHYHPLRISESQMESYYNDALFSIPNMPLDSLSFTLKELEAYSYEPLYKALDVLSSRFSNDEIDNDGARIDVKRFKNIYRKTFKKQLSICGKLTPYFIGSMRRELQLRNKYLDMLRDKFKEMIAIENKTIPESMSNQVSSFSNSFKPDNNAMKIDFNLIFDNAADYADDPDEVRDYINREFKKAEKESYYGIESFCKGILKIVSAERENIKSFIKLAETIDPAHSWQRIRYNYEQIDLIEQIVQKLWSEEKKNDVINTKEIKQQKRKQGRPLSTHNEAVYYLNNKKLLPFLIVNYSNVKPYVFNQLIKVLVDLQQLKEADNKEYKEAFGNVLNVKQSQYNFDKAFNKDPNTKTFDPIKAKIQAHIKTE